MKVQGLSQSMMCRYKLPQQSERSLSHSKRYAWQGWDAAFVTGLENVEILRNFQKDSADDTE